MKKTICSLFLAGGLFGATTPPTIPDRVAAVRAELNKRVADLGVTPKLPYAQMEVASWLNWANWSNWNNWRDWNNWRNWNNWSNWINY
jgi:hypothetical protein